MEIIGGIVVGLLALVLLAGIGLATLLGLALMVLLGLVTEMSFKKVFFVSFALGLLVPLLIGMGISGAIADGSLQDDLRDELAGVVELPEDLGEKWGEALPQLQEISRQKDAGDITEEEAAQQAREVLSQFEDFSISIDVDGDGESGVPLAIPDAVEAVTSDTAQDNEGN